MTIKQFVYPLSENKTSLGLNDRRPSHRMITTCQHLQDGTLFPKKAYSYLQWELLLLSVSKCSDIVALHDDRFRIRQVSHQRANESVTDVMNHSSVKFQII